MCVCVCVMSETEKYHLNILFTVSKLLACILLPLFFSISMVVFSLMGTEAKRLTFYECQHILDAYFSCFVCSVYFIVDCRWLFEMILMVAYILETNFSSLLCTLSLMFTHVSFSAWEVLSDWSHDLCLGGGLLLVGQTAHFHAATHSCNCMLEWILFHQLSSC